MIQSIVILVAIVALVGVPVLYAVRSWWPGKKSPKDRIRLIATFLEVAALMMIIIQAVITASNPLALWLWLTALVALAVGAAGATVRWKDLPWRDSKRSSWSMVSSGFGAVVCVALIGVLA